MFLSQFSSTLDSHISDFCVCGQSVSVSSEVDHNVHANIVKIYPRTNVSQIKKLCEQIRGYACVSLYCTSTIIGAFVKYTSRETAPLNKYFVLREGNVSNVVCQS